jgi:uncharacterized OsmC-like protein
MSQETLKAALGNTIEGLKSNPGASKVVFRADTRLEENVRCSAIVRDFPPMVIDEPPELGGANAGMNPVELILVALGTCQEIMYSAYASVMDIPVDSVNVDVKGYLDLQGLFGMADVPAGYTDIRYETSIESTASPEQISLLAQTVESHCPVLDTLVRPITVSGTVTHNGAQITVAQAATSA